MYKKVKKQSVLSKLEAYVLKSVNTFKQLKKPPEELLKQQDVIVYKNIPMLRAKYKSYIDVSTIPDKEINKNYILNMELEKSPFEILGLIPNKVQQELLKSDFKKAGSYLFNISCGGGKTLVSVELIHRLKLKTLIISARSAVNDQWLNTIKKVYPTLNVMTRLDASTSKKSISNLQDIDIFIITPQYLSKYIETYNTEASQNVLKEYNFDFIIYDEIHSLLSEKYSNVLALPIILKSLKILKRFPYMLGLTASLPSPKSEEYKLLNELFGKPITLTSEITRIPVDFIDWRDSISPAVRRKFDSNYKPLTNQQALIKSLEYMFRHNIKPSINYKLIVISHSIDDSIYAAIATCLQFELPVVVVRAVNETDYIIYPDKIPDEYMSILDNESQSDEDKVEYTLAMAKELEFMEECKYSDVLNKVGVIVGTDARLKEGFNCENICLGICTQFIYSEVSRVQILGRIRRSSKDEKLNNHTRLFIVNSGVVPSNLKRPNRVGPIKIEYDFEREKELFNNENYRRCKFEEYEYKEFKWIN